MTDALRLIWRYRRYLPPILNLVRGAVGALEDGKLNTREKKKLSRRFWKDLQEVNA